MREKINTFKKRINKLTRSAWFWLLGIIAITLSLIDYPSFDSLTIRKDINEHYYYTYYTSGLFATTSTYRFINVYRKRAWWIDQEIADIEMAVSHSMNNPVGVSYKENRLKIHIKEEMELDTLLTENQYLEINLED